MKDNLIQKKSYDFALQIIDLYRKLCKANEYVLSKQLLRSATSIGANVEEALAGQSRTDFLSKMSIASKEARESNYKVVQLLCSRSPGIARPGGKIVLQDRIRAKLGVFCD